MALRFYLLVRPRSCDDKCSTIGDPITKISRAPIGWFGRSAQYLGGLFGLMAILMAVSSAISKKLSIEESIALLSIDSETSVLSPK
jgi:hypothetical protein